MSNANPQITQETKSEDPRLIGSRQNEQMVGLSRWTLWRLESEGKFPQSIRIGGKRLWVESEVRAWVKARIAERG